LFDAKQTVTYYTTTRRLRELGVEQACHPFGTNLNLPVGEWRVHPGRLPVPWVPAQERTVGPRAEAPGPPAPPAPLASRQAPPKARPHRGAHRGAPADPAPTRSLRSQPEAPAPPSRPRLDLGV